MQEETQAKLKLTNRIRALDDDRANLEEQLEEEEEARKAVEKQLQTANHAVSCKSVQTLRSNRNRNSHLLNLLNRAVTTYCCSKITDIAHNLLSFFVKFCFTSF